MLKLEDSCASHIYLVTAHERQLKKLKLPICFSTTLAISILIKFSDTPSGLHMLTHASIYLGMLSLLVQNFI